MAHGDRRSMLSTHDPNAPLFANNFSMAATKPSSSKAMGSSRASMIPRQSMLPSRVPSSSGQENMLNPPNRMSVGPRSSMAVGTGYPASAMDLEVGTLSSAATPHRSQAGQSRRIESVGRMSVAQTPK